MHQIFKQLLWTASIGILLNLLLIFPAENQVRSDSRILREQNLPDRRLFYTSSELFDAFNSISDSAKRKYFTYLAFDSVYALVYPFFYVTLVQILVGFITRGRYKMTILETLPFMVAFADLVENFLLIALLFYFPQRIIELEVAVGWITWFKHILFLVVTFAVVVGSVILACKVLRSKLRSSSFPGHSVHNTAMTKIIKTSEHPVNVTASNDAITMSTATSNLSNEEIKQKETTEMTLN
jgi:hypothetical protein